MRTPSATSSAGEHKGQINQSITDRMNHMRNSLRTVHKATSAFFLAWAIGCVGAGENTAAAISLGIALFTFNFDKITDLIQGKLNSRKASKSGSLSGRDIKQT